MNEDQLDRALNTYADSLGVCQKQPSARASRRTRPLAIAAVGCVLLLTLAVSLWPRDAVAGTLNQVGRALKNVRTMEVVRMMETSSGKWHTFHHLYYKDGVWAHTNRKGAGLENHVVIRNGWALTKYRRLSHATLEEADFFFHDQLNGDMSVINYTKMIIDQGSVGVERATKIESHADVDGRPSYKIVMERTEGEYRAEIVVDKQTHLPLWVSTTLRHSSHLNLVRYRDEFKFNNAIPGTVFHLDPAIPVLRLSEEQSKLTDRWQKPLVEWDGTAVRDATITSDGTIWIACTRPFSDKTGTPPAREDGNASPTPSQVEIHPGLGALPSRLETGDGQPYARILDIVPSSILGKMKTYAFKGQQVVVVGFMPLSPSQSRPSTGQVVFSYREPQYPGFGQRKEVREVECKTLTLKLRNEPNLDLPDYFTALDLDHFGFQLPLIIWGARAKALEETGRTLEAAKAYERTAVEYRSFVKYVGYRPLLEAARCYRKLGLLPEAEDREREAEALKLGRER